MVVDRDQGVTLDDIAEVSRVVSDVLDKNDDGMGLPYVLEVTSPGGDRPLTEPRHWRRHVGRLVEVNGITGRLTAADDEGIVLDGREIGYADLGAGKVEIEFKRLDEADFGDDEDDDHEDGEGEEE